MAEWLGSFIMPPNVISPFLTSISCSIGLQPLPTETPQSLTSAGFSWLMKRKHLTARERRQGKRELWGSGNVKAVCAGSGRRPWEKKNSWSWGEPFSSINRVDFNSIVLFSLLVQQKNYMQPVFLLFLLSQSSFQGLTCKLLADFNTFNAKMAHLKRVCASTETGLPESEFKSNKTSVKQILLEWKHTSRAIKWKAEVELEDG